MEKISGFTFIKNGLSLGYPILESILSISPICAEVIINVGFSNVECTEDDGTYHYLKSNLKEEKYKFIKSWWDPAKTQRGMILSEQTDIALSHCSKKYCQYIQGDECVHEDDLKIILSGVQEMEENEKIEGLIFNYLHFYGNVDIYKYTRTMYRREVRLIRNKKGIKSWMDAQGFRKNDGQKIFAKLIPARIFHYGWARPEKIMAKKVVAFEQLYHGDKKNTAERFTYTRVWGLRKFKSSHPKVAQAWLLKNRNDLDFDRLPFRFSYRILDVIICDLFEKLTGFRIGEYKNYKRIK